MLYVHQVPHGEPLFTLYSVTVSGESAPLSCARVSAMPYNTVWPGRQRPLDQTEMAAFLSMESDGPVDIEVAYPSAPTEVTVRPLNSGVKAVIDGSSVRFTLPGPGQYTCEADGFHNALHIFIDPPKDWRISPDDPDVLYFGPGVHHVGGVYLRSGQTVYIDRDAVVYGAFSALAQQNVRICGYGIIDGSWETRVTGDGFYLTDFERRLPDLDEEGLKTFLRDQRILWGNVRFLNCRNVRLEGVTLRDSASFSVIPAGCRNVDIDYVKTIGMWRYNSDGIDLINSQNCAIRHCFLRDFDDCMVIKGVMGWDTLNNENITVENCVIWCDWGRALEIGAETCAPEYRNIIFRDCDVIHGSTVNCDLQHHNHADLHHILFDDIRLEYTRYQLPDVYQHDMTAPYAPAQPYKHPDPFGIYMFDLGYFCTDYRNGTAHDVIFKNIQILADPGVPAPTPTFKGLSPEHGIWDVVIENLTVNGQKMTTLSDAHVIQNDFVRGLIIR